jgi:predicted ATPase
VRDLATIQKAGLDKQSQMARKYRHTTLPPPYLKRVWIDDEAVPDRDVYPFCLPLFRHGDFELDFDAAVTILVGENGSGKSTLLEGIAELAGFAEGGGNRSVSAIDYGEQREASGGALSAALKGSWLPKVGRGWFFRAETFLASLATLMMSYRTTPTSSLIRMAKGSCDSSRSAAKAPAYSYSTSPNPRCRSSASSTS